MQAKLGTKPVMKMKSFKALPAADVDAPAFDSVIDANLSGPFYATAAVLVLAISLINVASYAAMNRFMRRYR